MDGTETVYVVIPVRNRCAYTRKCLSLIREQTYARIQTILVDDASSDGTLEMTAREFPEVQILRGSGDLYWTGAIHLGVERALELCRSEDYILVLNDDLVFDKNFIERLCSTAERHPKALIHALSSYLGDEEIIEFGGKQMNWWTAKGTDLNRGLKKSAFPEGHCEPSDLLWGRGLLIPSEVFDEIGNYDNRYQQSGDPEFSRRAALAGYELLVDYGVTAHMYKEENPNINERPSYALREWKEYFFGVLSRARVKTHYLNARTMTTGWIQGVSFFLCSLARHSWHFFSRVRGW